MAYPMYYIALRRLGLWKTYQNFCRSLGISTSSLSTAKPFYLASLIREVSPSLSTVLEIGAGTGNLAVILNKTLAPARYVIVDLPEMILYSSLTIRHFFPDLPIAFSHNIPWSALALPEKGFLFVFPQDIERIPGDVFDLCLNIDSFQEMTQEQVEKYISLIQRSSKSEGIFVNLNRRKSVGSFDNNPLLYPYGNNKVLRWETDPFMFLALQAGRKDPHLLRIERIQK